MGSRGESVGSRQYTEKTYWDTRFAGEEAYEWLAGWSAIAPLITAYIPVEDRAHTRVLLVGNGTSRLPLDLAQAGFRAVTATDYSALCVDRMRARCAEEPCAGSVTWAVADMTALLASDGVEGEGGAEGLEAGGAPGGADGCVRFSPASFDVVIDKAAMDAILADGADVWDPHKPRHLLRTAGRVMLGMGGVLVPGGLCMQLSFSQPHFRRTYLLQDGRARGEVHGVGGVVVGGGGGGQGERPADVSVQRQQGVVEEEGEDEFEPDKAPHLTPKYPAQSQGGGDTPVLPTPSVVGGRPLPLHCPPTGMTQGTDDEGEAALPWASLVVHDVPVGFGYFLYVLTKRGGLSGVE